MKYAAATIDSKVRRTNVIAGIEYLLCESCDDLSGIERHKYIRDAANNETRYGPSAKKPLN